MSDPLIQGEALPLVTLRGGDPVTTSTTIALGTHVEHRAVLQLIRAHLPKLERFGGVAFEMRPFQTPGGEQSRDVALLNERQATLLMTFMRNTEVVAEFKFHLVDAFFGMAQKLRDPVFFMSTMTRADTLRMVLAVVEERDALKETATTQAAAISVLEPKAAGLDRIAKTSEGAHTLTDAAKLLQEPPRKFMIRLQAEGWIYRQNGRWLAYQAKVTAGLMEHKFCTVQHNSGPEVDVAQPLLTPKGISRLAVLLGKEVAS